MDDATDEGSVRVASSHALSGLTVLEHGGVAAAYAAKMLADFGADVVALEPAQGDPLRHRWPHVPDADGAGRGAMYRYLRTNRRVIRGPLESGGRDALLTRSKVFVTDVAEEIRTGVGLDTATLRATSPHLIVVTISPFGATGPRRDTPGGELVGYAAGGLAQTSPGLPDRVSDPYLHGPLHPGGYPASIITGLTAAVATLCALPIDRSHDEASGDHLDVSVQAAVASMVTRYLSVTAFGGGDTDRSHPGPLNMPNLYLPCRDGYVVIAAILDHQWRRLVDAMGRPDWACDPSYETAAGRNADHETIELRLREWCLGHDGDQIVELAAMHGVPCFRFYRLDEMESSEHVRARGSLVQVPGSDGRMMPGAPFRLTASPWRLRRPAPTRPTPLEDILADRGAASAPGPPDVEGAGRRLPLEGIRVLDFGQVLAVPFGTQWMAWLGADVILVESKKHPHTRATPPFGTEQPDPDGSATFNLFNGGKRSLTVDVKTPEGRELLFDLVPRCDVVVENFRAGVLDRLGLSFDRLKQLRPDIILLSLGAFGRSGPMADAAGLHSAANLFSGLADVTRYPGGAPRIMGACLPDPLSGLNAVLAVLLALQHRRRTGEGQYIDQAMYEGLLPLCAGAVMADEATRQEMRDRGTQDADALLRGFFPARGHGEWLALEIDDRPQWDQLCDVVGFRRANHVDPTDGLVVMHLRAAVVHWLGERDLDEAIHVLRGHGLAAGRASSTSEVLRDEQLGAIGHVREIDHPVAGPRMIPTLPWRMEHHDELRFGRAPLLGEHVDEVLRDLLGYDDAQVAKLRDAGVLQ